MITRYADNKLYIKKNMMSINRDKLIKKLQKMI